MADPYGAGQSFGDVLRSLIDTQSGAQAGRGIGQGIATAVPAASDFIRGAVGLGRPSITVALPAARAAPVRPAVVATDPAALARLQAGRTSAAVAAPKAAAAPTAAAAVDPTAGAFGKGISFRQLLALSTAADHLTPRGEVHPPTGANAASDMLSSIYQGQFQKSLTAAGKDPAKQQAAVDAYEKKMLPLATRNPMADLFLGQQQPEQ